MKKLFFVLGIILLFVGCKEQSSPLNLPVPPTPEPPMLKIVKKVVVYDFWAPWCPPCRSFGPTFDAWKNKYANSHIEFKKVNIDEEQDLAAQFKVSSIPCVVVTVDGKETKRWVGAPKESDMQEYLK